MKKILKFFQNFSPKTKYVIAPLGSLLKWIFPFYDTWHDCCLFYQRRLGCQLDSNQRSWLETVSSHGPAESVTDIGWVGIPAGAVWSNRVSSSVSESRDSRGILDRWTKQQFCLIDFRLCTDIPQTHTDEIVHVDDLILVCISRQFPREGPACLQFRNLKSFKRRVWDVKWK